MMYYAYELPKILESIRIGLTPYRTEEDELSFLGTQPQLKELWEWERGDEVAGEEDRERAHLG